MTRAITSPELAKLRGNEQWSALYLAIHKPAVVFAALVNQSFASTDDVSQVTFDTVTTGAYTAILPGMTCYVGTSAGAYDLGMCRVRSAAATALAIGRTSDIAWTDNLYLTVVDEFGLWAKHWYTPNETTVFMDQDIPYSDQNANFDPVPVLGPDAVLWLDGATVTLSPTAANSWVLGSTISGYSWTAPGASATANLTTVTPTFTYNAAGQYRVSCTVTAANGKSFTGYRRVFVYSLASMPVTAFNLDNCSGDSEQGGWTFNVTLYDEAAITDIRERAKVILFAKDTYGGAAGSVGPLAGYENIIASGWIDEESIDLDAEQGAVRFSVKGPAYWLNKLATFPGGLKNSTDAPTDWKFAQNLTVDMVLHNLTHWRSTIDAVMDCYLSGDARTASGITTAPGSVWAQLREIGARILASPRCDRFGRLYVETDTQYTEVASRSSIPVVMDVTKPDWTGRIRIPRRVAGELALLETGGVGAVASTVDDLYFSRSYGKVPALYGTIESKDNLLVASQADLNTLTGHLVAQRNNPYPNVTISLAANNRMVDIAPRQYVTLSIASGDTERGLSWTAQKLIPRRVSFSHDAEAGTLTAELECEAETSGAPGLTVIPPQPPQTNIPGFTPPAIDFPFFPPGNIWFPPTIPGGEGGPDGSSACTALDAGPDGPFSFGFSPSKVKAGEPSLAYFPCTLRAAAAANKSYMRFNMQFLGPTESDIHFTAINSSQETVLSLTAYRVVEGYATFEIDIAPVSALGIAGFKASVDTGVGFVVGATLGGAEVAATSEAGSSIGPLIVGKWYAIDVTAGVWYDSLDYNAPLTGYALSDDGGATWYDWNSIPWVTQMIEDVPGAVNGYPRVRVFFQATTTSVKARVAYGGGLAGFADNRGSLSFALREAIRAVIIDGAEIFNICGAAA